MNEWKELNIDDLPSDILTGDYDAIWGEYLHNSEYSKEAVFHLTEESFKRARSDTPDSLYYRKRQPKKKQPSHEEIMKSRLSRIESARRTFGIASDEHVESLSDGIEYLLSLTFAKLQEAK